jgi:hypothetical protein
MTEIAYVRVMVNCGSGVNDDPRSDYCFRIDDSIRHNASSGADAGGGCNRGSWMYHRNQFCAPFATQISYFLPCLVVPYTEGNAHCAVAGFLLYDPGISKHREAKDERSMSAYVIVNKSGKMQKLRCQHNICHHLSVAASSVDEQFQTVNLFTPVNSGIVA